MQSAALGTQVGNLTMGLETDARAFTAGENTEILFNKAIAPFEGV